jgi:predicted 3-demethylubiquinone-9 3-methyltransferase (glyoxalase superfamily)
MRKITPFLWFDTQAEEAVNFYTSIFNNSKTGNMARYDEASAKATGRVEGSLMTASFQLEGQDFVALNGGPIFKFNPSISFIVNCKETSEVETLWNSLNEGAMVLMPLDKYPFSEKYGWLQDKYGVSWQLILSQEEAPQKIIPSLMFTKEVCGRAEEAINFYTSIFKDSGVKNIFRYGPGQEPEKEGNVMFADFTLEGETFAAMESAREHNFTFNEAISFVVNCEKQDEVDYYWNSLIEGGQESQCGWLKDKFGLSWQVVPTALSKLLSDPDREKSKRVMMAMLQMKKIDIAALQKAADNK